MLTEYHPRTAARMADCLMQREGLLNKQWSYDYGVVFRGMEALHALTGEQKYFDYIKNSMDGLVDEEGHILRYRMDAYNLDYICNGRQLLYLFMQSVLIGFDDPVRALCYFIILQFSSGRS